MGASQSLPPPPPGSRWVKVIDQTRCIGCHACTTACKSENLVPLSVTRTYVKYVDVGRYPQARRAFQVTRCNQCDDPPCVAACPTAAMYRRPDGIVDFDKAICIGCKACLAACPYDAIFINPEDHCAEKCNFCAHRLAIGLEPACVIVCPTEAILVGNLASDDPRVSQIVQREAVSVRRPEKGTRPKLFYRGAHHTTLDPLGAARPGGGLFMWSEQPSGPHIVGAGNPQAPNSSVPAVLSYDVAHRAPWDWRVSAYTWTKSVASGAYLVAWLLVMAGRLAPQSPVWLWLVPVLAGSFMALTGALLIWDLEKPARFPLIFLRPQWRSWLVRGGLIITAYSAVLAAHFGAVVAGSVDIPLVLGWLGAPLAMMTAVYTAYLFAQARGRDLWQNPLLPGQLLIQAVLAGAAVLSLVAVWLEPAAVQPLLWIVAVAVLGQVAMVVGEITLPHATAQARLAAFEMTRGGYGRWFVAAAIFGGIAALAPWLGILAAVAGLAALGAYEHAYIQAGQAPPLA